MLFNSAEALYFTPSKAGGSMEQEKGSSETPSSGAKGTPTSGEERGSTPVQSAQVKGTPSGSSEKGSAVSRSDSLGEEPASKQVCVVYQSYRCFFYFSNSVKESSERCCLGVGLPPRWCMLRTVSINISMLLKNV